MRADLATSPGVTCPSHVDAILFQTRWDSHRPAIATEGGILTYGRLAEAILAAAARCAQAGLQAGTVVGLAVRDPVWHVCLVCALHRLGVISTSIEPSEGGLPLGFAAILYDKDRPGGFIGAAIQVDAGWFAAQPGQPAAPVVPFGARDVCRVVLSSGTTGAPKPIAMSPEILWDRITAYSLRGSLAASQRIFCGPTLRSQFGFVIASTALAYGKMLCFAESAATAVAVMSFCGADLALFSPNQLVDLIDEQTRSRGGLATLREIQCSGAFLSDSLLHRLRTVLPVPVLNSYASTEAGTTAIATAEALATMKIEGAAGFIVPWARVDACDDTGDPLPTGQEGSLRVRALGMAAPFERGMTTVSPSAAFFPGDFGRVLDDGTLVVSGRIDDVINFGGDKLAADSLVRRILRCPGVQDAGVIAVDGALGLPELHVAVVASGPIDDIQIARSCTEVRRFAKPVAIHRLDAIPRNAMGKVVPAELRREVLSRAVPKRPPASDD
ncbi:AMP-binding protein [Rhodoplanes roseus]|nr:AMP-binding protein [Rhodoplanes roseus]